MRNAKCVKFLSQNVKNEINPAQTKEINVKIAKNHLMYSTWYNPQD